MSILMNEIKSSLYCFGDSVVTNLHGIGSSFRISHNLSSLDRRISKFDRIAEAYSKTCASKEPEVETSHPEEKSKVVFDEKEVSETVEFEENSNVIKKPAEETPEPVKEEDKVIPEPAKEEPVEKAVTESVKEEKAAEEPVTKPVEEKTPNEKPKAEAKPKPELRKEDIDKIINITNLQSKAEHKDTAKMVADSIISDIINNPNSDLNQKLASNIEQMTKGEEPKEPTKKQTVTKTPTSRKSGTSRRKK